MKTNYFINKDSKTGEIVYLEYNSNGYQVTPKAKKKDAIEVNKIVFVSPTLTEKLLKKKISSKISKLLLELNTFYDEDSSNPDSEGTRVRNKLMEAELLKQNLINKYKKYLDGKYISLTLKKLQIIIDGFNSRMNAIVEKKKKDLYLEMLGRQSFIEEEPKRGKGR